MTLEFLLASGMAAICATGVFLLLRARTWPVILGLTLIGYAVNIFLFSAGKLWMHAAPIVQAQRTLYADPLPAALVLTAIVIGFATTGLLIELALRSYHDHGTDHVDAHPGSGERRHDSD